MKNCENCYWRVSVNLTSEKQDCAIPKNRFGTNNCKYYSFRCERCCESIAEVEYNDRNICVDCLFSIAGVEEVQGVSYYLDGECLGDDSDDTEVLINRLKGSVDKEIKFICEED